MNGFERDRNKQQQLRSTAINIKQAPQGTVQFQILIMELGTDFRRMVGRDLRRSSFAVKLKLISVSASNNIIIFNLK